MTFEVAGRESNQGPMDIEGDLATTSQLDQTIFLGAGESAVLYNTAMRGFAIKKQVHY